MKRSRDYTVFRIRYYADGINVRKGVFSSGREDQDVQHHERAKEYSNFFWQMVERVTGHKLDYWTEKYFMAHHDCVTEELFTDHDILIPQSEEFYYWFVPKQMTELTAWITENCKLPLKIMKRAPYSSCLNNQKTTWQRQDAEEFTRKHLKNH